MQHEAIGRLAPVQAIADDRPAQPRRGVHADLVGPAGDRLKPDAEAIGLAADNPPARRRGATVNVVDNLDRPAIDVGPHRQVDRARLGREIDPAAEIAILPESEVMEYAEETGAIPFHHPQAELRHTGTRTGFDALRTHYGLDDPALGLMSLILRGAETNDRSLTQWSPGFWAIGNGLRQLIDDDEMFIAQLAPVLDGLYRFCQDQLAPAQRPTAEGRTG